jgi:AcrR family transcriptional regulator
MPIPKEKRRYSGQSFADRQAERRERLVRAAAIVLGRHGREASVAAICAEAGLTQRYFYESWPNREAIFIDAYRMVVSELMAEVARGIDPKDPLTSALTGFYRALESHRGEARVFLIDLDDHAPGMREVSREASQHLAKLFAPGAAGPLEIAGTLGAVVQIAKRWIDTGFAEKVETVVAVARAFVRSPA